MDPNLPEQDPEKLLAAVPDPLLLLDEELTVVRINPPVNDLFPDAVDSFTGKPLTALLSAVKPLSESSVSAGIGRLNPDETLTVPVLLDRGSGTGVQCRARASKLPSGDGYMLVLHEKDTGTTECNVNQSDPEFQGASENDFLRHTEALARVGGWEYVPSCDTLRWTDGTRRIHEVDMDYEPQLDQALNFYHEDDRETIRTLVDECLTDGVDYDRELRIVTAENNTRWVRVRGERIEQDGRWVLRGAMRDITERKEYNRELLIKTEAMDAVKEGITIADARVDDNPVIYCNDGFLELTGYGPDDVLGRNCRFLQGDRTDPETVREIREAIDEESPITTEIINYRKDGTPFWNLVSISPVYRDGTLTHYIGIQKDISGRKAYERNLRQRQKALEKSNKQLENFANLVTHDLKQPLRTITSYVELLEKHFADRVPDSIETYLEKIVRGTHRMTDQMDAIREFSKVSYSDAEFETVDLNEVLNTVRENLTEDIERTNARITVGDLPDVHGDRELLEHTFQNLITNGLKYSGEADPEVTVTASSTGGRNEVVVADRGIGIEPEYQDQVFDIFERLHTEDEIEGTGVGLALVQRVMNIHGGEIDLESTPREGTAFHLRFPAVD